MTLFEQIALKHFDRDRDGHLSVEESAELHRVMGLNDLKLSEFLALPLPDREAAEELWTADVLDANVKIQEEQSVTRRENLVRFQKAQMTRNRMPSPK